MPTPTLCTVSGLITDPSGTGINNVIVRASQTAPYIHPTDSSLILPYEVDTVTDVTGAWSLTLVETETATLTITISISYPTGQNGEVNRVTYPVTIPDAASATFASLLT